MKKILAALMLLGSAAHSYSQSLKEFNVIKRDNKDIHLDNIIGANSSGFYCWAIRTRGKGTDFYIEKYDLNGQMQFSKQQESRAMTRVTDKSILLYFVDFDAAAGKKTFYYEELSGATGENLGHKTIAELSCSEKEKDSRIFRTSFSPDESKVLVVSQSTESGGPETTQLQFLDVNTMKPIWKQTLPVSYKGHVIRTDGFRVDNDGNAMFELGYLKQENESEAPRGSMAVLKANSKDIIPVSFDVNVDVTSFSIKITDDGKAILAGVFKDPEETDRKKKKTAPPRSAGLFYVAIDLKEGKAGKSTSSYFTEPALQKLTYKTNAGGKDPGDKYISIIQIVEMNKTFYVVAENSFAITVSSNNGSHTTDYHMELIVSKLKSDGTIEWTKVLPKATGTRETYAMSDETASTKYNFVINNGKMNFIYLDHPKNAKKYTLDNYEPGELGTVQGVHGPNLICVSLDAAGNAERSILHENEDFCVIPQVEDVLFNNKKDLLIYMKNGKEEKFGTIGF
jgi:hypothetical protein